MSNVATIPDWAAIGNKVAITSGGYRNVNLTEGVVARHTKTQIVVRINENYERRFYMPKWGMATWEEVGSGASYRTTTLRDPNGDYVRGIRREAYRRELGRAVIEQRERLTSTATAVEVASVVNGLLTIIELLENFELGEEK